MIITSILMSHCFIIIFHQFLIPFSIANSSGEDNMLIAFMKGQKEMPISEYSKKKFEAHLGIIHYIRMNWQCEKIADEFEEFERTECQKYRKCLDILYEYLFREYVGVPTVKPKFVFKNEKIEINGPIIYVVNCLVKISAFYFVKSLGKSYKYKLSELFNSFGKFEPKMLNEEKLNYLIELKNDEKLSINEMILQLAIDTANKWPTDESLNEVIRQKFDENLKKMFKKAEDSVKKENISRRAYNIYYDKHLIICGSKFDDQWKWAEDALFSEFVKGLAKNSAKFSKMSKEYLNYLCKLKEYGLGEIEKMHEHLKQQNEAILGIVYLMKMNWQCDKIKAEFEEKCQKYRKYVDILHEYLFHLYAKGKHAEFFKKFSTVKPIFFGNSQYQVLISVVEILNNISSCFWGVKDHIMLYHIYYEMNLQNEDDFIDNGNWFSKFTKQNVVEKINGPKNVQKKGDKILDLPNKFEDNLRQEFEDKMKEMYEKTENAKKENTKLKNALRKAKDRRENELMRVK